MQLPYSRILHVLAVLLVVPVLPAKAVSFDCKLVHTAREKAVCADPQLGQLDDSITAAYKRLRQKLSDHAAAEVQLDQRAWLHWIDLRCGENYNKNQSFEGCLVWAYRSRLLVLQSNLQLGHAFILSRLDVELGPKPDMSQDVSEIIGLGHGIFEWPEIDNPTPKESAWNAAVRQRIISISATGLGAVDNSVNFLPEWVSGTDFDVSYVLHGVNEKFISTEFYWHEEQGGVHGHSEQIPFEWWVDKQRALSPEDIFNGSMAWQHALSELAWTKLVTNHKDDIFTNDAQLNQRKSADDIALDSRRWLIDQEGLQIVYPEYSVGPYSSGILTIKVTWAELRPYLTPSFSELSLSKSLPPLKESILDMD